MTKTFPSQLQFWESEKSGTQCQKAECDREDRIFEHGQGNSETILTDKLDIKMRQGNLLSKVRDYRPDDWGLILSMSRDSFSLPLHPEWLWSPSSLLSNGYQGLFPVIRLQKSGA
jgi:hypothetical protein